MYKDKNSKKVKDLHIKITESTQENLRKISLITGNSITDLVNIRIQELEAKYKDFLININKS